MKPLTSRPRGLPRAKRVTGLVLGTVLVVMLLHATAIAVYLLDTMGFQSPWYASFLVVPLQYAVPVLILLALYLVLSLLSRKKEKEGSEF